MKRPRREVARNECPAPGCTALIPGSFFACGRHWSMLPAEIKHEVWAAYNGRDIERTLELYARAARVWNGER